MYRRIWPVEIGVRRDFLSYENTTKKAGKTIGGQNQHLAKIFGAPSNPVTTTTTSNGSIEMCEQMCGYLANNCKYGEFQWHFPQLTVSNSLEHLRALRMDAPSRADDYSSHPELDLSAHVLAIYKMFKHSTPNWTTLSFPLFCRPPKLQPSFPKP